MASHDGFKALLFDVRPGKGQRIEQYLLNILGKRIPVPKPEMQQLISTEKDSLQVERREKMINTSNPLRHSIIVCVFGFAQEPKEQSGHARDQAARGSSDTRVGSNLPKSRIAFIYEPQADVSI
jgi:hypothetical protein